MARIKWEDRRYNGYFTMAGVGKRPRTRPDKDLKHRLGFLQFRASWRKIELYRKRLISRIAYLSGECRGRRPCRPEFRQEDTEVLPYIFREAAKSEAESAAVELSSLLDSLKAKVSSSSPGGLKHLLKMVEEILRLLSRVFHPTFTSLTPCFAGQNISASANPRGPPRDLCSDFCSGRACSTAFCSGRVYSTGSGASSATTHGPVIRSGRACSTAFSSGASSATTVNDNIKGDIGAFSDTTDNDVIYTDDEAYSPPIDMNDGELNDGVNADRLPLTVHRSSSLPGPVFRIQTRPRKLEMDSSTIRFLDSYEQASDIGNCPKPQYTSNQPAIKQLGEKSMRITSISPKETGPSFRKSKIWPGSKSRIDFGLGGLVGLFGAYLMPKSVEANPGDYVANSTVSTSIRSNRSCF
ncbi:MAG: hypothetical protein U9N73_04805 [Candidatus Auribacterota bacterium]|nr:hypothetical protein [Candidatus Auribacterota bacterium]